MMVQRVSAGPSAHCQIESQSFQSGGKSTAQVLVAGIIIKQELVLDNNLPENWPY